MDPRDLKQASYRGAFFFVSRTTTSGGRKDSKKELVGNDRQVIEDLGLKQRTFSVSGIIAARRSTEGNVIRTYQQVRDELLDALELGGPGLLVHPFYGELRGIVARTWSISESMSSLGFSNITMTFEVSNEAEEGAPEEQPTTQAGVDRENEALQDETGDDIGKRFEITESFAGNFKAATDKVNAAIQAVEDATDPLEQLADEIDAYNAELASITADVINLVQAPLELADSLTGIMATVRNLYNSPVNALKAFANIFDFGDADTMPAQTTAARIERQKNDDVINGAMQVMALGYSYSLAAESEFPTVDEIDDAAQALEAQYKKMVAADQMNPDQVEALNVLRLTTRSFFQAQRLTRPKVITVRTSKTSAQLLAYRYYGSTELADTISKLNDLRDPANIPAGDVKILELPT